MNSNLLSNIDKKSNIAGENRMMVLLFYLASNKQSFGINVFKVREVLNCPKLHDVPGSHKNVMGLAHVRGESIPVIDLARAINFSKTDVDNVEDKLLILTEFNSSVQGFLVDAVDKIEDISWEKVEEPPSGVGINSYLTSVANLDNNLIQILDVEQVLAEIEGDGSDVKLDTRLDANIMIMDDSVVARKQLKKILEQTGAKVTMFNNGKEGLEHLKELMEKGQDPTTVYDLIISDIEMPQMDGYAFTSHVKGDDKLKNMPVILHTSLSGSFNTNLVKKVGADGFVSKFNPKTITSEIEKILHKQ